MQWRLGQLTKGSLVQWRAVEDKKTVGTTLIGLLPADLCRSDQGYRVRTGTCTGAADLERGQIPLPSLLLATVLTARVNSFETLSDGIY
jgi:hypothetical protein